MEEWEFEANKKTSLQKGHIVVLCTDGIWEACNVNGEMFGKETIYNIIREHSGRKAAEILDAMLASLNDFQKGAKIEDDVTVVVVKINR
jgi:sigma-B regulation protein RsbU (phosphoserine phosphatase)